MRRPLLVLLLTVALTVLGFGCNAILGDGSHTLDVCVPGSTQCSGGAPETCDVNGMWQSGTCPSGQTCSAGSCSGGCSIGGSQYAAGTANPANACLSCQPGVSTTAWSDVADGTTCATAEICSSGSCISGCDVGGNIHAAGATNAANPCQTCEPETSTTSWTTNASGTACGTACVDVQTDTLNCGECGRACPDGGTCSSGVCVNVYAYTGADQTYTVPTASCGTLTVEVWAAGGGGNQETFSGYVGGGGGYTDGILTAMPGQVLTLIVGQGGAAGPTATYGGGGTGAAGGSCTNYSGQGGGRSAVRVGGTEVLTAGGGGGSGCNDNPGGFGGGLQGGQGFSGNPPSPTGGTQTAGGVGSVPATNSGTQYQGGSGLPGGGGGGGGYFGGGGNGSSAAGNDTIFGSGGGGSGYCAAGLLCSTTAGEGSTGAHQTGDWVAGVGNGGTAATSTNGGNGLIVVRCGS